MIQEVTVPRLSANEDEILVTEIVVEEGERVEAGDELFVLETTKISVSVEAEEDGYVRRIFLVPGEMAEVGAVAMLLTGAEDTPLPETVGESVDEATPAQLVSTAKERLEAKKRRAAQRERAGAKPASAPRPVPSGDLPWVREARAGLDGLEAAEALFDLKEGRCPAGAERSVSGLGDASFGVGSLIRAKRIFIEPGASVGPGTVIEAESVYLGRFAKVGGNTKIVASELILGDGSFCGHDVEVDVSGGRTALSRLLAGPASLVSPRCFVNVCREVVLEEEAALSPGASVFTHRFWQSVLDGYSADFSPVRLCKSSWVGGGCHVLPGVVLGEGSTVMSNSTVSKDVPPFALAAGVPAAVVDEVRPERVTAERKREVLARVLLEFADHLELKRCAVERLADGGLSVTLPDGQRRHVALDAGQLDRETVLVSLTPVDEGADKALAVLDIARKRFSGSLEPFVHELRNFLRRRGIRFAPHGWDGGFRLGLAAD